MGMAHHPHRQKESKLIRRLPRSKVSHLGSLEVGLCQGISAHRSILIIPFRSLKKLRIGPPGFGHQSLCGMW